MVIIAIAHTKKGGGFFSRLIIAILAAILFPVFAKAREKARQTSCLNNQRQIVLAGQLYAQEHDELMPTVETFWGAINLDRAILQCPTAGTKIANGYVYSTFVAGRAMGELSEPSTTMVICDGIGKTAPNVCKAPADIDWRHLNRTIASFMDGHVDMTQTYTIDWFGGVQEVADLTSPAVTSPATTITYNAAGPGAGTYALDLSTVSAYTGKVYRTQVGTRGYALFQDPTTINTTTMRAPFTAVTKTGSWAQTYTLVGGGNDSGPVEPNLKEATAGSSNENWWRCNDHVNGSSILVNFSDPGTQHLLTVICPKQSSNGAMWRIKISTNPSVTAHEEPRIMHIYDDPVRIDRGKIYQLLVSYPVTFTIAGNGPHCRNYPIRTGGFQAIFFD
jgi:prepilin-type processing-associated H-X9-DG protein